MILKDTQCYSKGIQFNLLPTPNFSMFMKLLHLLEFLLFDEIPMIAQESYTFQVYHFFLV